MQPGGFVPRVGRQEHALPPKQTSVPLWHNVLLALRVARVVKSQIETITAYRFDQLLLLSAAQMEQSSKPGVCEHAGYYPIMSVFQGVFLQSDEQRLGAVL